MAFDKERVHWSNVLILAIIFCVGYIIMDAITFLWQGQKFIYVLSVVAPGRASAFIYYPFAFSAVTLLISIFIEGEVYDILVATQFSVIIFLLVNGVFLTSLLIINPSFGADLIPVFEYYYGGRDLLALLPLIIRDFWIYYSLGSLLFEFFCFPFILTCAIFGQIFGVMLRESRPTITREDPTATPVS